MRIKIVTNIGTHVATIQVEDETSNAGMLVLVQRLEIALRTGRDIETVEYAAIERQLAEQNSQSK